MSAAVCGKRSYFEDSSTEWSQASKRVRCGAPHSPRFPASPPFRSGSEGGGAGVGPAGSLHEALEQLRRHFPKMDTQVMVKVLQTCENNIDAAIKCLTELRLTTQPEDANQVAALSAISLTPSTNARSGLPDSSSSPASPQPTSPTVQGPEGPQTAAKGEDWVELVVSEMSAASSLDDAKGRAGKVLQEFEAVVRARVESGACAAVRESAALKEHVAALSKDNHILKRAVQIQAARQAEADERLKELGQARQTLQQYQEQLRALEVTNYALSMHLRKAQEQNSMPGRFHPDVF